MNFLWRPFYNNFGNDKQIFTSAMRDGYFWPNGFWHDEKFLGDDSFISNRNYSTFNADVKT